MGQCRVRDRDVRKVKVRHEHPAETETWDVITTFYRCRPAGEGRTTVLFEPETKTCDLGWISVDPERMGFGTEILLDTFRYMVNELRCKRIIGVPSPQAREFWGAFGIRPDPGGGFETTIPWEES